MRRVLFLALLFWPVTTYGQDIVTPHSAKDSTTITRSLSLLVTNGAVEVAAVTENYKVTYIAPALAKVCDVPRLERNLVAAAKGSKKATRYINKCLTKIPKKQPVNLFSSYPAADCAGQHLQADSQGCLRWVPPCKEIK